MKHFDAVATRDALDFESLVARLRQAFVDGCHVPLRHSHVLNAGSADEGTVLIMPAWEDHGYLGIKTVNIFPGNAEHGMPGLHSTYVLYDGRTGNPLAQLDGNEITSRRTAAASALAATYLARPDASRLVLLGSLVPLAYRSQLPISHVEVWDKDPEAVARLVDRLTRDGFDAAPVTHLEDSVRRADVVTCATLATEPIVRGRWLAPGSHLDLIGSFTPRMREADDDCFRQAEIYVDTDEAAQKSGDLLGPLARNVIAPDRLSRTLTALCRGEAQGRTNDLQCTVFKAVGTALEDLAAAIQIVEKTH
ncbi:MULTISPECIES: ornithine cyclodeaminase family protein [Burkholderia]|uniref:ornithine cyclodeaminase family protein n=1 Tax=Burkholderia TaxID=32008 RepID=UPI000F5A9D44|nr:MULTISPECIES: ornithine cyclodeaminase family protein [Burkholderia]MBN3743031.1 ornithine cyclodeaminase family protein [Burkholderia sp. Tr-20355]RQS77682.1 ornithine cyclodeaminase family protein [Burkholderia seminalis]